MKKESGFARIRLTNRNSKSIRATNDKVNDFFGRLFSARDYFHLAHLRTVGEGSYASHKALNELYESILDLIDGLVESYQGIYGVVYICIPETMYVCDPIVYLEDLYSYIETNRIIFQDSFIQNEIDEIQKLLASTQYKLKNLK